jgi:phosphatidylglycerol:prolipoprotein diacylglycerol transferase
VRPILFQWRGFTVWSYPAMLYVGLVLGVVAGNAAAHAAGLDAFRTFVATLVLIVPALAFARLLHVALYWRYYRLHLGDIWNRSQGGAAQYGGLLAALPISVPVLALLHLPLAAFWDVAIITILVGMMFVRVGCLLNGCCAGRPSTSWAGVRLPNHRGEWSRRIPSQLLEAGWSGALLAGALGLWRWLPFPGALCLLVIAGYAAGRLVLESLRERLPGAFPLTVHHAISALLVMGSLGALAVHWRP